MRPDLVVTKDDVARLTRGKASKNRCGSRQIRHRLRLDELERMSIARSRGYLLVTPSTRAALRNAWYLDCVAASRPCIYVERTDTGYHLSGIEDGRSVSAEVSPEQLKERFTPSPDERKVFARSSALTAGDEA
jgi:hypothetical protein